MVKLAQISRTISALGSWCRPSGASLDSFLYNCSDPALFQSNSTVQYSRADSKQRKLLEENYGKHDAEKVAKVKELFAGLHLEAAFKSYEEESYAEIQVISKFSLTLILFAASRDLINWHHDNYCECLNIVLTNVSTNFLPTFHWTNTSLLINYQKLLGEVKSMPKEVFTFLLSRIYKRSK